MAYLLVIGFISILGQVVLLRELNVAFYGVELIYTLAIGVWLFSSGDALPECRATKYTRTSAPASEIATRIAQLNSWLYVIAK